MNDMTTQTAIPSRGSYRHGELRPFSNRLFDYTVYALRVRTLREKSRDFEEMTRALREDEKLHSSRLAAQTELQHIYDHIAFGLRLPRLPVRLPLRKRAYTRGAAVTYGNAKEEIRLYFLQAPHGKPRPEWKPTDLKIVLPSYLCEVFLHEIAHIHQRHFTGHSDHEQGFVDSYHAIEAVMLGFGFGPLLRSDFRFSGCPPNSKANELKGTPRPGSNTPHTL